MEIGNAGIKPYKIIPFKKTADDKRGKDINNEFHILVWLEFVKLVDIQAPEFGPVYPVNT